MSLVLVVSGVGSGVIFLRMEECSTRVFLRMVGSMLGGGISSIFLFLFNSAALFFMSRRRWSGVIIGGARGGLSVVDVAEPVVLFNVSCPVESCFSAIIDLGCVSQIESKVTRVQMITIKLFFGLGVVPND